MTTVKVWGPNPPIRVVFDGQSLLKIPSAPNSATLAMSGLRIPFSNVAISATSWTTLATTVQTRLNPHLHSAVLTILILLGGSTDVADGDSGATVFSDLVSYADNARLAGADVVIAGTITPMSNGTHFTAGEETARLAHNSLVLADGGTNFDAVFDAAAAPLDDPMSSYFGVDHTHPSQSLGVPLLASRLRTVIESFL